MGFIPNQLVRHSVLTLNGIGVVVKVLKRSILVKWKGGDYSNAQGHMLRAVELPPGVRKIPYPVFKKWTETGVVPDDCATVILGNEVRQWVGIGWVDIGLVQEDDLGKYPIITDQY